MQKRQIKPNLAAIIAGVLFIIPGITYAVSASTPLWGIIAIIVGAAMLVFGVVPSAAKRKSSNR